MITAFKPIIDENCKIIILGSMPSVKSLEKQEYYGHKQNHFWKIIYQLFNREPEMNYENKKSFLLNHNIALWDVLNSCDREGSSDSKIVNPVPNDFEELFNKYPNIKTVFFNGSKAEELFKKFINVDVFLYDKILFFKLPSTSPANAIRYSDKLTKWKLILEYLR